ncbi:MAG: universal stress protein [Methyloligellaceae bacterium]
MLFNSILLSVDLNAPNSWKKSTEFAVKMAQTVGAELHVIAVLPDFGMSIVGSYFDKSFEQKAMQEINSRLTGFVSDNIPSDVKSTAHIGHGSVYDEIMKTADKVKCDAIVIGAHRPELKDYLLGPNAARVVRHANQSVFVIRD